MEREVVATRRGVAAGDGAVMQADVIGVAATAYDHWDSRLGDPQLHTHVVISNKVKTTEDGRWRSLDGTAMYEANVPHLRALQRRAGRPPHPTVRHRVGAAGARRGTQRRLGARAASPRTLIREFSSRSSHIDREKDRLIAEYVDAARAAAPPSAKIIQLRAKATLATRPEKEIHSLFDLTTAVARTGAEDPREGRSRLGQGSHRPVSRPSHPPRRRRTPRRDHRSRRLRRRRGRGEALDLEALEPLGRGIPADDGLAVRQRRRTARPSSG